MTAVLGRYEPWGRLSAGGMSEVWLARHASLAIPVVIKTLRPDVAAAIPDAEDSLASTAGLCARVSSPHVTRVLDVGHGSLAEGTPETPCLVEEYVDGLDLAELDSRRRTGLGRPLPLFAVADIVAQAAAGLHAAHQHGILHRDVKPANLFADAHGRIRVGDFGVAIAAHGARHDRPAGTPHFMAPEQILGGPWDRRTDVFSLGATAFALRYGQPPWADTGEMLRSDAPPGFPGASTPEEAYFQHVLAHALARRPEVRPPTARHVELAMRSLADATRPRLPCARVGASELALRSLRVILEEGDISEAHCDAIVNSAYTNMDLKSGVGAALKRRGGMEIEEEAMAGGARPLGECVVTQAGALRCQEVIHAVGAWREISCVSRAFQRVLLTAEARGHRTLAVPAIGTGRGAVSLASCADALASCLRLHVAMGGSQLREVRFVLYGEAARHEFEEVACGLLLGFDRTHSPDDELAGSAESWEAATLFASDRPPPRV